MITIAVIAGNHDEFKYISREIIQTMGHKLEYVSSPKSLLGKRIDFILYVGTCLERPDFDELNFRAKAALRHA